MAICHNFTAIKYILSEIYGLSLLWRAYILHVIGWFSSAMPYKTYSTCSQKLLVNSVITKRCILQLDVSQFCLSVCLSHTVIWCHSTELKTSTKLFHVHIGD